MTSDPMFSGLIFGVSVGACSLVMGKEGIIVGSLVALSFMLILS